MQHIARQSADSPTGTNRALLILSDGTRCHRNALMVMEATMARDPDASEWGMLKGYFAALADHDPAQEGQPVEAIFDPQIRRRFGDWIARSARTSKSERKNGCLDNGNA